MGQSLSAMRRAARFVQHQEYLEMQLPFILGDWRYVVPGLGSDTGRTGKALSRPLASVNAAYDKTVDGRGDGIAVISYGTTSAHTTTYLTEPLDWAKYNITMIGIAAGGYGGRARISNTAADLAYLIDFQGQNNRVININMSNYGSGAAALGSLKVSGARNRFDYVNAVGAGHITPGAVAHAAGGSLGAHDLNLAASECHFNHCIFGTRSVLRAEANANIVLSAQMGQNFFEDCYTFLYTNTATQGAIAIHAANVLGGWVIFKDCTFTAWYQGVNPSVHTSMVIGAVPDNCGILLQNPAMIGWASYETGADKVFVTNGAGLATGGLGIKTA